VSQSIPVRRVAGAGVAGAMLFGLVAAGCDRLSPRKPEPAASNAESSRKPCDDFAARLCGKTANDLSTTCIGIKTTVDLFTLDTCKLALENVDHSLELLGQRNLSCDDLQAKLCADTDPSTKYCEMVKKHMRRFPVERCQEMLGRYPDVLADLKRAMRVP
jgi:hypothetical protein